MAKISATPKDKQTKEKIEKVTGKPEKKAKVKEAAEKLDERGNLITLPVEKLKKLLSIAVKGAGSNKLSTMSGLVGIVLKEGLLKLYTTDSTSILEVSTDVNNKENCYISVELDPLFKLISKFTCESIKVKIEDSHIELRGNGTYKIARVMENDKDIVFEMPSVENSLPIGSLKVENILELSKYTKVILSGARPELSGIFLNKDGIAIATDSIMGSFMTLPCKQSKDIVIVPQVLEIFKSSIDEILILGDSVNYIYFSDNSELGIKYITPINKAMEAELSSNIFPAINKFAEFEMDGIIKLDNKELIGAIDRLSIFSNPLNGKLLKVEIGEGVELVSEGQIEILNPLNSKNNKIKKAKILLSPNLIEALLKSCNNDEISFEYGHDVFIRINTPNIKYILSMKVQIEV